MIRPFLGERFAIRGDGSGVIVPTEAPSSNGSNGTHWLFRLLPAIDSLRDYSVRSLGRDAVAGLTVAAVAVPQAMAYATIAQLPPQYGLYTAIVMTFVGAIFDSSKQLINGPTNAISIALLSALAFLPDPAEKLAGAILLAFLIGAVQTGITLLRLGDLTRYISHAVIVGFTLGAAVLLVMDQLKNLCGLREQGSPHDHFLVRWWHTQQTIGQTNLYALSIGLGTIALALALRWINNRLKIRLPEFLIAVAATAAIVGHYRLDQHGVAIVGNIPPHLPSFAPPNFNVDTMRHLAGSALAVGILGLLEAVAMAKAIAARTRQKLDINQQCLSEGLANLAGSFFQCFPGSGSLTRSIINVQAGAVTQWSGVFAALAVALTVVLFAPFAYYIPRSALAGILMVSAYRLIDQHQLVYHLRTTRQDAGVVIATALAAVVISVEFCILIGILMSFVLFVPRAARIHLSELILTSDRVLREKTAGDPDCDRIQIYSLEGELFFGSAPDLDDHFEWIAQRATPGVARVVVLRLKRVRNPDAVCIERFDRFFDAMAARGVIVLLCGIRPDMARILKTSRLDQKLGADRIFLEKEAVFSSTLDAVRRAYELAAGNLCEACPRRTETSDEALYYMI